MTYIKYCKKEHNFYNTQSVFLGNFQYYREIYEKTNDLTIGDPNEGDTSISVMNIDQENPADQYTQERMGIKFGSQVSFRSCHIAQREPVNCHIFCTSFFKKEDKILKPSEFHLDYDDYYEITDIYLLASNICTNLKNYYSKDYAIGFLAHKVQYSDTRGYVENGLVKSVKKLTGHGALDTMFIKETRYEDQKEFRIVFLVYQNENNICSVNNIPLSIDFYNKSVKELLLS